MKSFRKYLAESVRSYRYKIKIAGECPKNFIELFCYNLQKYDPVKIGDPKTTPVQKSPLGFPDLTDQPVTIIDVEFRYPATEPMIRQTARLLGCDENCVRMIQADYSDSLDSELEQYANQASHTPVLTHTELEDQGKEASKEYSQSYLGRIREQEKGKEIKQEFAKTEATKRTDPFEPKKLVDSAGLKSPMTTITRPSLPATGARKK
jgi:hypothetical protein